MRTRLFPAIVACAAAVAVAGLVSAPASGSTTKTRPASRFHPAATSLPALVSPVPVSSTPNIFAGPTCQPQWLGPGCPNSSVFATAVVNGDVVVAGAFTQACQPGSPADGNCTPGTLVTRNDIFAYSLTTGTIDPNFVPVLDQGPVFALAAGPNNTVYAGGNFTTVNGAHHAGVVQLSVAPGQGTDGQVVPGFNAEIGGVVNALAVNGSALYAGGQFKVVDGAASTGLVRLNATTGTADSSFNVTIASPLTGTGLFVQTMSVSPDGTRLVIGGSFRQVDGQSRVRVAEISTGGSLGATATLANWAAPILASNCSLEQAYVNAIDFSPDGSYFVVVTTGNKTAGAPALCDVAARFPAAPAGTSIQPAWVNYTGADTLHSVAVTGSIVYVGGHNRWVNNECGDNHACEANAFLVNGLAALDPNTGLGLPWWEPGTNRGVGVTSLVPVPAGAAPGFAGGLIIGTDVNIIGGSYHGELAMFPLTTSTAQTPGGPVPSGMFSQGRIGGLDETNTGIPAMCLDDAGNGSADGTRIQLWTCLSDTAQNWTVQPDGTLQINGKCLALTGNPSTPANGTKVQLSTCAGQPNQRWLPGAGNTLVNQAGGKCLDDPGASTKNGTQLQIWSCNGLSQQTWPLPAAQAPPPPPATGPVSPGLIQANNQVPCLNASGSNVMLWSCTENQAQNWTVELDGTIRIYGMCLDTNGGGTSNGTLIVLNACNGSASQVWTPRNFHTLVNQATGKCLDDTASSTVNGATLQIWTCNGLPSQEWWWPTV